MGIETFLHIRTKFLVIGTIFLVTCTKSLNSGFGLGKSRFIISFHNFHIRLHIVPQQVNLMLLFSQFLLRLGIRDTAKSSRNAAKIRITS